MSFLTLMGPAAADLLWLCFLPLVYCVHGLAIFVFWCYRCHQALAEALRAVAEYVNGEKIREGMEVHEKARLYAVEHKIETVLYDVLTIRDRIRQIAPIVVIWVAFFAWYTAPTRLWLIPGAIVSTVCLLLAITLERLIVTAVCIESGENVANHKRDTLHQGYVQAQWLQLEEHLKQAQSTHALTYTLPLPATEKIFYENKTRIYNEYCYNTGVKHTLTYCY